MGQKSSTLTTTRITSAQKFTGPSSFMARHDLTALDGKLTQRRAFRETDPPAKTVSELAPDDIGHRVVIRSGDFLGTVYGTLLAVHPHDSLTRFTCVQLYAKKLLTFRDDMEVVVLD